MVNAAAILFHGYIDGHRYQISLVISHCQIVIAGGYVVGESGDVFLGHRFAFAEFIHQAFTLMHYAEVVIIEQHGMNVLAIVASPVCYRGCHRVAIILI